MKEAVWGWWFMVLGLTIIGVIILITDMTTTSEQDYYMVKEIAEASMMESVDYGHYRKYGELRINSEKFMENFLRRFAEVITINKNIDINFYDLYESPPKVSIEVSTSSSQFIMNYDEFKPSIINRLDAILEMYAKENPNMKEE